MPLGGSSTWTLTAWESNVVWVNPLSLVPVVSSTQWYKCFYLTYTVLYVFCIKCVGHSDLLLHLCVYQFFSSRRSFIDTHGVRCVHGVRCAACVYQRRSVSIKRLNWTYHMSIYKDSDLLLLLKLLSAVLLSYYPEEMLLLPGLIVGPRRPPPVTSTRGSRAGACSVPQPETHSPTDGRAPEVAVETS